MRIWIDLSNSPHPLLFAPVARHLASDGHEILLTARDNAQTVQLARERWPEVEVLGGLSPPGRVAKGTAVAARMNSLRRWARRTRPEVALSHNSYAQILTARLLGIPSVTAMDYEYQPANHLAFRLASTVILPEVVPLARVRRQGAKAIKVKTYPGVKEELYVGDFSPDAGILQRLGLDPRPRIVVVARTPPHGALYHEFGNPLFERALRVLCSRSDTMCVALPRRPEQRSAIERLGLERCVVPHEAVDSRSLIHAADAMVGAGGTMTREAAVMGIATWTAFAGRPGAVDEWLERRGTMRRLRRAEDLSELKPRTTEPHDPKQLRANGEIIEDVIVEATLAAAMRPSGWCR